jgi:tungstate transport system substrate-binding protein
MRRMSVVLVMGLLLSRAGWAEEKLTVSPAPPDPQVVRCAVIGGMTMTGMWQELSKLFEAKHLYKVQVVATGPRPGLAEAMHQGQVDLLTMHSGDITTDLVADGYGVNMRPWTRNDLVIVGPASDPAGIAGMNDGSAALKRIAETHSRFLDWDDAGAREMAHNLWKRAGIKPQGEWLLQDQAGNHLSILEYAQEQNAYLITGRMPVISHKMKGGERMRILVDTDPMMRRPYIVMEANPDRLPGVNVAGARALSDFMLSNAAQRFLDSYSTKKYAASREVPLFYPLRDMTEKGTLHLYSTDSIQPALDASAQAFERTTGILVKVTYCKTKQAYEQAKQESGDIYFSSHSDAYEAAKKEGLAVSGTQQVIAYLTVAIVVPKGNPQHITCLADMTRKGLKVGLGDPAQAQLGRASEALLTQAGMAEAVKANVIAWGSCCSKTAELLTSGQVEAVLGWATFGKLAPDKVEVIALPIDLAGPLPVTGFVLTTSQQAESARQFLSFLQEGEGKAIFTGLGYRSSGVVDQARQIHSEG